LKSRLSYYDLTRHYVHVVSRFVSTPTIVHWGVVLRILRYI